MTKPKTLDQLRAEKERAETQLAQEKHKPKTKGNDSLDDYDYGEEDSEEWETENEELDEPDADGGSTEEDDEDSVK